MSIVTGGVKHGETHQVPKSQKFLGACSKNGGRQPPKLASRGGKFIDVSGGKEKCEKAGEWAASQQFTKEGGKEYSRVFYSAPRNNVGEVQADNWDRIFTMI